ncbi:sulfate/molybdate ABC transporter ATP-binding protein [Nocardioides sp. P5_C9_2]
MSRSGTGLDVDLEVPGRVRAAFVGRPGQVIALIGPNGAGKSSVVHALAGLVRADGRARLDDLDLLPRSAREREVGLVFQDRALFPHLSARDNVAFGPRSRGVSRREARHRAEQWLARVGLADLADRRPGELSGGQAQRVAIARALATEPRLLLLDEPMAGLDVTVAMALRIELARHLRDYDGVTLLVTHDALDALALADHVVVLDGGRVAQQGTPDDVAAHPRTSHVARLVGLNLLRDDDGFTSFRPQDVTVSLHRPDGSARLAWSGPVTSAQQHGDAVRLLVGTDPPLLADVTPQATAELDLAPGRDVWLSVKATAVRRYGHVDAGR